MYFRHFFFRPHGRNGRLYVILYVSSLSWKPPPGSDPIRSQRARPRLTWSAQRNLFSLVSSPLGEFAWKRNTNFCKTLVYWSIYVHSTPHCDATSKFSVHLVAPMKAVCEVLLPAGVNYSFLVICGYESPLETRYFTISCGKTLFSSNIRSTRKFWKENNRKFWGICVSVATNLSWTSLRKARSGIRADSVSDATRPLLINSQVKMLPPPQGKCL